MRNPVFGFPFLSTKLLTAFQLKMVCPTLTIERAGFLADLHNKICPVYAMLDYDILHEFIANCAHESGEYRIKSENMNYSAERLLKVFGKKYFINIIAAKRYEYQPEKLANYVYGGRMGNKKEGDGWRCRGGGFIQLTGWDMYVKYYAFKHKVQPHTVTVKQVEELGKLIRERDDWALDSACWLFAEEKKLIDEAVNDEFYKTVRSINGGYNGLEDREKYYGRAKKYIV